MAKTAMQELIDIIDNEVINHSESYNTLELNVFSRIKNRCLDLLEKEKQQIVNAWMDGKENKQFGYTVFDDAEKYFTYTFNL